MNQNKKMSVASQVDTEVRFKAHNKKLEEILKESEPILNLYLAVTYLQRTGGKFPTTLEEYKKNISNTHDYYFDSSKEPSEIHYWIRRGGSGPDFDEMLYEFDYKSSGLEVK